MGIEFITHGKLPAIQMQAPDGAQVIVTLFGANIVSWKPRDGNERLFCVEQATLEDSTSMRGGIPIVFPQFNLSGSCIQHGFARLSHWEMRRSYTESDHCFAEFSLSTASEFGHQWPFSFYLSYTVKIYGDHLDLCLTVKNTDARAFSFSGALHSFLRVENLAAIELDGLQNLSYTEHDIEQIQSDILLAVSQPLNRIYRVGSNGIGNVRLRTGKHGIELHQKGFSDLVIWNPDAKKVADYLSNDEGVQFICVEPAVITPYSLEPGCKWSGHHKLTAIDFS